MNGSIRQFCSSSSHDGPPGYRERSGMFVTVVRPLTDEEADIHEVGPMYRVRFDDGVEADVFDDELLSAVSAADKVIHDNSILDRAG